MITKQTFISAIDSIQRQTSKDMIFAVEMGRILNNSDVNPYDTTDLTKTIISLLQVHFPRIDGHCEIEFYVYDCNCGKIGEDELITPENLWERLVEIYNQPVEAEFFLDKDYLGMGKSVVDYKHSINPVYSEIKSSAKGSQVKFD